MSSDQKSHESLGRLVSCISRLSYAFIKRRLGKLRIGRGQFFFLKVLSRHDGISQNELSEMLTIDKATTARAIKKLQDQGYVTRRPDPHDNRINRLSLTVEGWAICTELDRVSRELEDSLLQGFSSDEKATLQDFLQQMAKNVEQQLK